MSAEKNIQFKLAADGFGKLATSRRHRRVLLAALAVIAAVGLYRWILGPYGNQLFASQKYDFALASVLRKAGNLNVTVEKKREKLDELTARSKKLRNELFTPVEARDFLSSLSAVARQTGCVIQSVSSPTGQSISSTGSPASGSGIVSKKAVVTYDGGYGSMVAFINELQTYQRRVWIDSVRIEAGGNAGRLKCQLILTLYCVDNMEMTSYE